MARPKSARTIDRDEPEERLPTRDVERETDSLARLDPNAPIKTRSGREARLTFTGNEDQFDIYAMGIRPPPGWEYAWKVKTVNGVEQKEKIAQWEGNGWEPVPADRHDGLCMPKGFKGNIERGGQILCERDERLGMQSRAMEKRAANQALKNANDVAGIAMAKGFISPDMADFSNSDAKRFTGVRSSREAIGLANPQGYRVDE